MHYTPEIRRIILAASALYFLSCGATAIAAPEVWYLVAGLSDTNQSLALDVVGAMMTALGVGAALACFREQAQQVVAIMLFVANAVDFAVVVHAIFQQLLPFTNGLIFCVVDSGWCLLLLPIVFNSKLSNSTLSKH